MLSILKIQYFFLNKNFLETNGQIQNKKKNYNQIKYRINRKILNIKKLIKSTTLFNIYNLMN